MGDHEGYGAASAKMVDELLRRLRSGLMGLGEQLPTQDELAARYGISINSVRRGIDRLIAEGYLRREQGRGTFVTRLPAPEGRPACRDTVVIYQDINHGEHHPYFSAMRRGAFAGLVRHQWNVEVHCPPTPTLPGVPCYEPADEAGMEDYFASHPNVLGAILTTRAGIGARAWLEANRIRYVVLDPWRDAQMLPHVRYDREGELEACLRLVMEDGMRSLLVVSGLDETPIRRMLALAQQATGCHGARCCHCRPERPAENLTALLDSVRRAIGDHLDRRQRVDAIVVDDDILAQGVLDAIHARRLRIPDDIRFAAVLNAESRLMTPYIFPSVVLDGVLLGETAAHLMHAMLTEPGRIHDQVILRGTIRSSMRVRQAPGRRAQSAKE